MDSGLCGWRSIDGRSRSPLLNLRRARVARAFSLGATGSVEIHAAVCGVADAAEEPDGEAGGKGDEGGPAEDVDEAPEKGLALHLHVHGSEGGGLALSMTQLVSEVSGHRGHVLLEPDSGARHGAGDLGLVVVHAADEHGGGERDADRSTTATN